MHRLTQLGDYCEVATSITRHKQQTPGCMYVCQGELQMNQGSDRNRAQANSSSFLVQEQVYQGQRLSQASTVS